MTPEKRMAIAQVDRFEAKALRDSFKWVEPDSEADAKRIGGFICRGVRAETGLGVRDFGLLIGIKRGGIAQYESGAVAPSLAALVRITAASNSSLAEWVRKAERS